VTQGKAGRHDSITELSACLQCVMSPSRGQSRAQPLGVSEASARRHANILRVVWSFQREVSWRDRLASPTLAVEVERPSVWRLPDFAANAALVIAHTRESRGSRTANHATDQRQQRQ